MASLFPVISESMCFISGMYTVKSSLFQFYFWKCPVFYKNIDGKKNMRYNTYILL